MVLFQVVEFAYSELSIHQKINIKGNIEIDYINAFDGPFNDSRAIIKEWEFGVHRKNYPYQFMKDYAHKLNHLTGGRIVHQKRK